MSDVHFDIFTVRQWRECYTLEVGIARPRNAPRYKFTNADYDRIHAVSTKNMELVKREFATLEDVIEEIRHLQFPVKSELDKDMLKMLADTIPLEDEDK